MKKLLAKCYRGLELLIIYGLTTYIICHRFDTGLTDRASYTDDWEMLLVAMAWVFFISIPIVLIYVVSLFRAIPFRAIWQKVVLAGHILNVVLWFAFYFSLPKTQPCTAANMEQHYLTHQQAIDDLIQYTKSCLKDSCDITIGRIPNNELDELAIRDITLAEKRQWASSRSHISVDSILKIGGINHAQLDTIRNKMTAAGIIGLNVTNNGFKSYKTSYLTFKRYGKTWYQYIINHDQCNPDPNHDGIFINDSVEIETAHNMIGHDFADRDQFIERHQTVNANATKNRQ